jgi:hypothetical protein
MNNTNLFSSEIVRKELIVMKELYDSTSKRIRKFPELDTEQRQELYNDMESLVEKQELLYTRVMLCDDDDSELIKKNFRDAADAMGIPSFALGPEIFKVARSAVQTLRDRDQDLD